MLVSQLLVNEWARLNQNTVISSYEQLVDDLYNEDLDELWQSIDLYNQKIAMLQQDTPFRYTYYEEYDENYMSLPINDKEEMCSIIIDEINLHLPIGHGTLDDTLLKMAGHMYLTSLPVPSKATHSVIVGHTGLRSSQMFDNLDKLAIGNLIKIKFLDKVFIYEIDEIRIELPEECDKYLQIIPSENLLTLYTCTPYGVNSHRLLVRAKFINEEIKDNPDISLSMNHNNLSSIFNILIIILLPFILMGIGSYLRKERRKCQLRHIRDK